jgi:hypothetical protein
MTVNHEGERDMTADREPAIPGGPLDSAESRDEARRRSIEPPRTLYAGVGREGADRRVFDPALKHFAYAFRPLDPSDSEDWRAARQAALDTVLAAVSGTEWAGSLVLRGSMLLAEWFAGEAREPHDLDFVVVPPEWRIGDERTGRMLDGIASAAQQAADKRGGLTIDAGGAESEYIWTYDRVPGRRLVLPWVAPGLPGGQVQLDFVFNEQLPAEPVRQTVSGVPLMTATRELSLAWKVLWLVTDLYPQGKDLYDAVLLAEHGPLRYELLLTVFRHSGEWPEQRGGEALFADIRETVECVEWEHLVAEYPQFAGARPALSERLLAALAPTFAD